MLCEYDNGLELRKKYVFVLNNNFIDIFYYFGKWIKYILIILIVEYIMVIMIYFLFYEYIILVDFILVLKFLEN